MNLQHLVIKIPVEGEPSINWKKLIEVFHSWVAEQSMGEMMIDVADYRHVPKGPGVVLVGHEADYALDEGRGQQGLRYNCKAEQPGDNQQRVQQAFAAASSACARLEQALDGLKFSRTEFQLTINDRAIAPNNDQTHAAVSAELPGILESILGAAPKEIQYHRDPRELYGATIRTAQPFELAAV